MDSEVAVARAGTAWEFELELKQLVDAVYGKYHYDFRGYTPASLRRRVKVAMNRFACGTVSQLQDRVLHDPAVFAQLLDFLTVGGLIFQ